MQAMILAAGLGTRLLPYTAKKPKPLFPLLNIPLLLLTIERLRECGFDRIIINAHHLQQQISEIVKNIPDILLQEESKILGTGGGLRFGLHLFRDEPLLVTNGDIYHSIDMKLFYQHHLENRRKVSLAVHNYPRFNSLECEGDLLTSFDGHGKHGTLAFTGIHVINPEVLEPIPFSRKSCIIDTYRKYLQEGGEIGTVRVDGCYWTDIGTPADYLELHAGLFCGKVPGWSKLQPRIDQNVFISDYAKIGKNVEIVDWASLGDAVIGDNVVIKRSVIWDGACIPANSKVIDSIVAP